MRCLVHASSLPFSVLPDSPSDDSDDGTPALPSTAADEPKSKQPRLGSVDETRQPTNDEINELRETESLFHSSLFRLQVPIDRFRYHVVLIF